MDPCLEYHQDLGKSNMEEFDEYGLLACFIDWLIEDELIVAFWRWMDDALDEIDDALDEQQ